MSAPVNPLRDPSTLRSARWFAPDDQRSFRAPFPLEADGLQQRGLQGEALHRILNTWSEMNNCHTHFRDRAEEVKARRLAGGRIPGRDPVMSMSESFMKPTSMFYRNLLALEVEENDALLPARRRHPHGGCDKTVPALIMGATSAKPSGHLHARRPHAEGMLARRTARLGHGHVEILGRTPGRQSLRGRLARTRGRHRPLARPLHDHGHGPRP